MDQAVQEASAATRQAVVQPTIRGSVYVKPQDLSWEPTQFKGISIKVLYEDKAKGETTCLLKWEPGATLPMHKHSMACMMIARRRASATPLFAW